MHNPTLSFILLINILFIGTVLKAQDKTPQKIHSTPDTIIQLYKNKLHNELNYINGREYKPYHYPNNQNPYLKSRSGIGSVFINGSEYQNKKLLYDTYKNLLVVNPEHYQFSNTYIQLNNSLIDSFTINIESYKYLFINIKKATSGCSSGFYEKLYKTKTIELLIKHYSERKLENSITTYTQYTANILYYNGYYYDISSKRKLLTLFPNNKPEIKRKINSINHSYKKMSPHQLIHLIQFIDAL